MTENGKVIEVREGKAVVRMQRNPACASCGKCMMGKKDKFADLSVQNGAGAAVGDTVAIELGLSQSIFMLALVYVLPLLLMTAAFLIAIALNAPQYVQGIAAGGTLILSFAVVFLVDRTVLKKNRYKPQLVAVVSSAQDESEDINSSEIPSLVDKT